MTFVIVVAMCALLESGKVACTSPTETPFHFSSREACVKVADDFTRRGTAQTPGGREADLSVFAAKCVGWQNASR